MDIVRELSKIYDIKKYSICGSNYDSFYIEHNDIKISIHIYYIVDQRAYLQINSEDDIDSYIKRIEFKKLFIDKITNLFIYTVDRILCYDSIIVGNIRLCCGVLDYIIAVDGLDTINAYNDTAGCVIEMYDPNATSEYNNIDDLVEYLKLKHLECVKNLDIKIALKN